MQLSKRLKSVADFVTEGNRVADIGCDHAYTSIYLMENQIASHVIAMDINKGPLERAKKNIKLAGLESYIETRLSNGADKLEPEEVDTILIAGMGGNLMVNILSNRKPVIDEVSELILQPQSEIFLVRKYLEEIGFDIIEESMLIDEGKYYVIIKAVNKSGKMVKSNVINKEIIDKEKIDIKIIDKKIIEKEIIDKELSNKEMSDKESINKENISNETYYLYGKKLLENKNTVLKEWLDKEYQTTSSIIDQLKKQDTDNTRERVEELSQKLKYLIEGMSFYE